MVNPIPTGTGRNQAIYEYHVATAGRNRVKAMYVKNKWKNVFIIF